MDGDLVYLGHFDDGPAPVPNDRVGILGRVLRRGQTQLEKSLVVGSVSSKFKPHPRSEADLPPFAGVVAEAARIVPERYPTSEFHVLFTDVFRNDLEPAEEAALAEYGLVVHLGSDVIPDLVEDFEKCRIEGDGHPNALANHLITQYVVAEIIEP